jgi:hypothetical protein
MAWNKAWNGGLRGTISGTGREISRGARKKPAYKKNKRSTGKPI